MSERINTCAIHKIFEATPSSAEFIHTNNLRIFDA